MRPLSFTRNLGGLSKVYYAIKRGYAPGITVPEFKKRCGLDNALSHLVVEFFLFTQVRARVEYVVRDTLIEQTLARPKFDLVLARLYFFAVNLAIPGERVRTDQQEAGRLQRHVLGEHIYVDNAWHLERMDKSASLEPFVRTVYRFPSVRKWVNNYSYMMKQCKFVGRPDGTIETFPDTWGLLALRLFFERYSYAKSEHDVESLASAALRERVNQLIGVDKSWLAARVEGAADIFVRRESYDLDIGIEGEEEREAAKRGRPMPKPKAGSPAQRRAISIDKIERRGDNRRYIRDLYRGVCQVTGITLRLPGDDFTVDCAHIRPLGIPHQGPDDVGNMLSLSPSIHRLFDRGCIYINPTDLSVKLLHGNDELPHLDRLIVSDTHRLESEHIAYYNAKILR
jgi:hypothetical protein